MMTHPTLHAALAAERQAALLADARADSLVRQARRATPTSPGRPSESAARRAAHRTLLTAFRATETIHLTAPARDVFDLLIDVDRIPEWNAQIHHVVAHPGHPLTAGDEWVVQMRAMGRRWPTRSKAIVVDPVALRFEYRSRTDDENPSYAYWIWQVRDSNGGSTLSVTWGGYPRSFWRRLVLARARRPLLAKEVRASLAEIDAFCAPSAASVYRVLSATAANARPDNAIPQAIR